jgi:SAM-dependent methyltransferase
VFSESGELYDAIYGAFKDYAAEAAKVVVLLRTLHPGARTILDVGCGTGEHAKHLHETHGLEVDGLDLDAGLLAVARRKRPGARFFEADMCRFDLGRRYDVVTCLFSSIGYVRTPERLTAALRCFAEHLEPGGAIVVEPWFAPGVLREGPGPVAEAACGDTRVQRTSHLTVRGRISCLVFDYEMCDGSGARSVREVHELGLFTREDMLSGFEAAGLRASFDPVGLTGRGLYTARAAERTD